jgi:hypothetical protein
MYVRGYLQGSENGRVVTIGLKNAKYPKFKPYSGEKPETSGCIQPLIFFSISMTQPNWLCQSSENGRVVTIVFKQHY